jgi:hypothetical protein
MKKSFHASFISNKKGGVKKSGRVLGNQKEDIMVHFVQPANVNLVQADSDQEEGDSDEEDEENYG